MNYGNTAVDFGGAVVTPTQALMPSTGTSASDSTESTDGWIGSNADHLQAAMRAQCAALNEYRLTDEAAKQWACIAEHERIGRLPASGPCEPSMIARDLMTEPLRWRIGFGLALLTQRLALAAFRRTGGRARLWAQLDHDDALHAKRAQELERLSLELQTKNRMDALIKRARRAGLSVRFPGGGPGPAGTAVALCALGGAETHLGFATFDETEAAVLRLIGERP